MGKCAPPSGLNISPVSPACPALSCDGRAVLLGFVPIGKGRMRDTERIRRFAVRKAVGNGVLLRGSCFRCGGGWCSALILAPGNLWMKFQPRHLETRCRFVTIWNGVSPGKSSRRYTVGDRRVARPLVGGPARVLGRSFRGWGPVGFDSPSRVRRVRTDFAPS